MAYIGKPVRTVIVEEPLVAPSYPRPVTTPVETPVRQPVEVPVR